MIGKPEVIPDPGIQCGALQRTHLIIRPGHLQEQGGDRQPQPVLLFRWPAHPTRHQVPVEERLDLGKHERNPSPCASIETRSR